MTGIDERTGRRRHRGDRRPRARAARTLAGLECSVLSVGYHYQRRTGRLDMPPGNCCDIGGLHPAFSQD
jgi:hypothetical protein